MTDIRQSGSYTKLAKPIVKITWRQKALNYWRTTWYFERLMILIVLLLLPFAVYSACDEITSQLAMVSESAKLAATLRQIKERAHKTNTCAILEARLPDQRFPASYVVRYLPPSGGDSRIFMPKGLTLSGAVRIDPQGVPDGQVSFTIRHGLTTKHVLVSEQGLISIP
ncbi:MAG: hypothetical protein K2Y22_01380 [Candidatus Obscuribacterales bacterium]|nr:hypothetical protein [Candidatus Obscuribacterales bacterium]